MRILALVPMFVKQSGTPAVDFQGTGYPNDPLTSRLITSPMANPLVPVAMSVAFTVMPRPRRPDVLNTPEPLTLPPEELQERDPSVIGVPNWSVPLAVKF